MEPIDKIIQLYVGYLGRAPDPEGLAHYKAKLDAGETIEQFAAEFANSVEAKAKYPYLLLSEIGLAPDSTSFVNSIYQNLFGRDAEEAGSNFWKARLESGESTVAAFVMDIANGAQDNDTANDKTALAKKVAAAKEFTTQLAIAGIQWNDQIKEASVGIIANVDASSTADGEGGWEADIAEKLAETGGERFKLTDGDDLVVGTPGNDTISGVIGKSSDRTLDRGDSVDGGAGIDTLEVYATANVTIPSGLEIDNVEIVYIINDGDSGANVVVSGIDSSKFGDSVTQLWQQGGIAQSVEVAAGVTAGFESVEFSDGATGVDVSAKKEVTGIAVALTDVSAANNQWVRLNLKGSDVTEATVSGSIADSAYNRDTDPDNDGVNLGPIPFGHNRLEVNAAGATKLETLKLGLTGASEKDHVLVVNITGADALKMLDASSSTGNLLFTNGDSADGLAQEEQIMNLGNRDFTFEGGSGVDVFSGGSSSTGKLTINGNAGDDMLTGGAGDDTIMGGAGDDMLTGGAGDDTIMGGAGDDTIMGGAGDDMLTGGAGKDSLTGDSGTDHFIFAKGDSALGASDTISSFTSGTDKIVLKGEGFTKVNSDSFTSYGTQDTDVGLAFTVAHNLFRGNADLHYVTVDIGDNLRLYIRGEGSEPGEMIEFTGINAIAVGDFMMDNGA